jgi:hypothetical protein
LNFLRPCGELGFVPLWRFASGQHTSVRGKSIPNKFGSRPGAIEPPYLMRTEFWRGTRARKDIFMGLSDYQPGAANSNGPARMRFLAGTTRPRSGMVRRCSLNSVGLMQPSRMKSIPSGRTLPKKSRNWNFLLRRCAFFHLYAHFGKKPR